MRSTVHLPPLNSAWSVRRTVQFRNVRRVPGAGSTRPVKALWSWLASGFSGENVWRKSPLGRLLKAEYLAWHALGRNTGHLGPAIAFQPTAKETP